MKILIVSWYFPPCSTMGALRVGKFAKYLVGKGHDVRVVCAKDQPYPMNHPVEVPSDIIYYTRWRDVNWLPAMVQVARVRLKAWFSTGQASAVAGKAPERGQSANDIAASSRVLRRILNFYQHMTNIPDGIIGWLVPAIRAARTATIDWEPDIVFASAPPFTTLIAGRMIASRVGAPLVVEYRDRWMEDPYGQSSPKLRRWLDRRIEEWCVRPARGIVTVSEPWADDYRARWEKPVTVSYNGYDPDDMIAVDEEAVSVGGRLTILYTGIIYPERRDPTPLFQALSQMGEDRKKCRVEFYGSNVDQLESLVDKYGQQDIVSLKPGIPIHEALALQQRADVLLLLQWNNALEAGNVPGKLFEYLAARRPVLGIGYEDGVPARMLRERGAGSVLNRPEEIAAFLKELLDRKARDGVIQLLPESVKEGLSRPEQYANAEALFSQVRK